MSSYKPACLARRTAQLSFALTMPDSKPTLRKDRVRLIYLLKRRKDMTHEEFANYWLNVHSKVFIGSRVAHQYIYTLRYDQVSWGEN